MALKTSEAEIMRARAMAERARPSSTSSSTILACLSTILSGSWCPINLFAQDPFISTVFSLLLSHIVNFPFSYILLFFYSFILFFFFFLSLSLSFSLLLSFSFVLSLSFSIFRSFSFLLSFSFFLSLSFFLFRSFDRCCRRKASGGHTP